MYPNIDNTLGQETIEFWLSNYPEHLPQSVSKDLIIKALKIVLQFQHIHCHSTIGHTYKLKDSRWVPDLGQSI